jgi:hypothetical protein
LGRFFLVAGASLSRKYSDDWIRRIQGERYFQFMQESRRMEMQVQTDGMLDVRQEMIELLRQQMSVLESGDDLSDAQLRECYERQGRVQQLREKLEMASNFNGEQSETWGQIASASNVDSVARAA